MLQFEIVYMDFSIRYQDWLFYNLVILQIQLTPAQLQAIQMQLQGKLSNQPIIIQTTQQQASAPVQTVTQSSQAQQFTQVK